MLSTATGLQADLITPAVLEQGLKAAKLSLEQQAALNFQTQKVRTLLEKRGTLSDEAITLEDLKHLGFRSFSDVLPLSGKLAEADLAYQLNQADVTAFAPVPLPSAEDESSAEQA